MNRYLPALLLLVCQLAGAQKIPVTPALGMVSEYECSFRKYDTEPYVSAMILWESCDRVLDYDMVYSEGRCITYYKQRIKILRESGRHFASDKIVVDSDAGESVKNLEVTTYNLEDGKVVSHPASKSDITRTWLDDKRQQLSYRASDVKAGSVIEISYVMTTPLFDVVPTFNFRRSIPVNFCSYTIAYPEGLQKRMRCLDYEQDAILYTSGQDAKTGLMYDAFQAADLPSFKDEPMVYCPGDYMGSVAYEIGRLDWSDVAKEFSGSAVMQQLKGRNPFRKEVKEIVAAGKDRFTTMCEVVDLVKKSVKWNGQTAFFPKDFSGIGSEYFGTSADVNSVAGAALTDAGFFVTPVLLCLRSDGVIFDQFPTCGAFSTFILHISDQEDIDFYLDAANPLGYYNVLPDNYLVSNAMEIFKDGSYRFVDLSRLAGSVTSYTLVANMLPDGNMAGTISGQFFNNSSFRFKENSYGITPENMNEKMLELLDVDSVTSASIDGLYVPSACTNMKVKFIKKNEVTDSLMTVSPFMVPLLTSDAFRSESRRLPVEFPYPESIQYVVRIGIPHGYEIASLPEPVALSCSLPSECMMSAMADETAVSLYFKFDNKAYFASRQMYGELRDYWLAVCDALQAKIVFRKID